MSSSAPNAPTPPESVPASLGNAVLWTGWAAAAGFALATAYFGTNYFATRAQLSLATRQAEFSLTEAQSLTQRLEAERILNASYQGHLQKAADLSQLKVIPLASPDASTQPLALIAWNPLSQEGVLIAEKLPPLPAGQVYQLWLTTPAQKDPVSAGLVTPGETGSTRALIRPDRPITNALTLSLTLEPQGGSPTPQGPTLSTTPL